MTVIEYERRKRERERRESMRKQKLAGIAMILLGILVAYVASKGISPIDTDCSGALFIMLIGAALVFTRDRVFG